MKLFPHLVLALFLFPPLLPAQDVPAAASLFDGKTLTGWDYDAKIWRTENGTITGGSTTEKIKANDFICTTQRYQNFELKLSIRCSGDPATGLINSGIQIRSERVPGGAHMAGYQVDCGDKWFGKIYDEFRRRRVIAEPLNPAALAKAVDTFGWNEYRIRADGPRIQVWINNIPATDYTETDPHIPLDGLIATQVHSGGVALVQFKDVTLTELPPTPNAPTWKSLGGVEKALTLSSPKPKQPKAAPAPSAEKPTPPPAPAPAPKPAPPAGKKTQSARTAAWSPAEELAGFTVPPGFSIELVASEENGVINPIDLSFDDAGRLWTQTARMYPLDPVAGIQWNQLLQLMDDSAAQAKNERFTRIRDLYQLKTKGQDEILILRDPTKPATGPLHVWADGLSIPQSILPYKDGAYVAHGSEMFLLRDTDGDGKADKTEPVLTGFGFTDTHTMSHLLIRGPGRYIHFTQGALNKGLVTAVASGKQHRIDASCQVRFGLDHQDFEVLSAGPSNMWGLQLRANGQWYGTEANDRAYCVMPWEHGTAVTGAAFRPMRAYQPLLPELHKFRVGGTGISGLAFAEDAAGSFPAEWKDVALLANPITNTINAVRIRRNPEGTVTAEHLPDFLTATDDWFRPVNLEFGPDGCLYVADFYNKIISHNEVTTDHPDRDHTHGRIWRIRHRSQPPRLIPDVTKATPEQLLTHLQAPGLWEKRAAWHQIGDRRLTTLSPALTALAADEKQGIPTRIHALWCLEELQHFDGPLLTGLLAATDDDLRREAVRSLASFDLPPADAAARVQPALTDANCMVRSQAIRTLGDLRQSDPAVISLLVSACKPALPGNAPGGSYERHFERFLARMALERFPAELKSWLNKFPGAQPAVNVLWAMQALDDDAKKDAFPAIWKQVSGKEIDSETFVAIAGMLGSREVFDAVAPVFRNPAKAAGTVRLALANQSRVQTKELGELLTPIISQLLKSPDTLALALSAAGKLKITGVADAVASLTPSATDLDLQRLLLAAREITPVRNAASFAAMAGNAAFPLDLRFEATHALTQADAGSARAITLRLLDSADDTARSVMIGVFSQSKPGALVLATLFREQRLAADLFDLSAAERIRQAQPKNPDAAALLAAVQERVANQRRQARTRIHGLMAHVTAHPGDPAKGKLVFNTCLTCHKVGNEGTGIAPPLDGSGHRDLEALLTAIVDPDAAVEGGYGLYRITRTDGSTAEGLLEKEEPLGTTIALMGGARVFVPVAEIAKAGFAGGRSFMTAAFGQFPDETMADLVAWIATLKESAPAPR